MQLRFRPNSTPCLGWLTSLCDTIVPGQAVCSYLRMKAIHLYTTSADGTGLWQKEPCRPWSVTLTSARRRHVAIRTRQSQLRATLYEHTTSSEVQHSIADVRIRNEQRHTSAEAGLRQALAPIRDSVLRVELQLGKLLLCYKMPGR